MFVKLDPGFFLFFMSVLIGTIIGIFAGSPVGIWFAIEVNFFGAVSLFSGKRSVETDSTMKYFIRQALGSGLLFLGILFRLRRFLEIENRTVSLIGGIFLLMGFNMKIGLFPFHFWVPRVMSGCSWINCFILSRWQKILPLWLIRGVGVRGFLSVVLIICRVATALAGGLGGLGQVYFRPLIGYSSLVHRGWMVLLSITRMLRLFTYLVIYRIILLGLLYCLSLSHSYCLQHVPGLFLERNKNSFWVWVGVYFISLGGLPPFFGSALKILGVLNLSQRVPLALLVLIGSSLIRLFYYLNMFFNFSLSFRGMNSKIRVREFSSAGFASPVAIRRMAINIGFRVLFIMLGFWYWL